MEEDQEYNPDDDPMAVKLKSFLYDYYVPVTNPREAEMHLSTHEIWEQLMRVYHNELITKATVARWLHEGGFQLGDYGGMRIEWMLKSK